MKAAQWMGTPVDVTTHPDVGDYLLSIQPHGLNRSIAASGFRSTQHPPHAAMRAIGLERDSSDTVASIIKATRKGSKVALICDFLRPMMQKALTVRGGQAAPQRYQPFLLDLFIYGCLDPSWLFAYVDEFENILEQHHRFARHEMTGGLKVCLVTAFGRSERMKANNDLVIERDG